MAEKPDIVVPVFCSAKYLGEDYAGYWAVVINGTDFIICSYPNYKYSHAAKKLAADINKYAQEWAERHMQ
jgi:hypothetical protein